MSPHNTEVEIRAILLPGQTDTLKNLLQEQGAQIQPLEHIIDIYFCPKEFTEFSQVAMKEIGSYSLRVRQSQQTEQTHITINTKTITHFDDHSAWEEHEVETNSFHDACQLFIAIGYKPFFKIDKTRIPYLISEKHLTINIEDIKDFATTLEAEIITDNAHRDEAKQTIRDHLITLGISNEQIVPKSINNLLMQEKSDFSGNIAI